MTDELDDLKRAFDIATPQPDAQRREEHIALAKENFAKLQGSRTEVRPMNTGRTSGLMSKGVRIMLNSIGSKAGLTATTALAAVGLLAVVPALQNGLQTGMGSRPDAAIPEPAVIVMDEAAPLADGGVATLAAPSPAPMVRSTAPAPARARMKSAPEMGDTVRIRPEADAEAFANAPTSGVLLTSEVPVSTFSVDVDTASYAYLRSSLSQGVVPPAEAVRIEEMVNYFPYDYAAPDGAPFATSLAMMQTPWNADTQLLRVALQGQMPEIAARPPLNLVLLIDTSGSMNQPDKLPLLKQSMRLMLGQLRAEDEIAIVTYAGSAGQVLAPTDAGERADILAALDRLDAGGSTNGQAGLEQAYDLAERMRAEGEIARVLLATDGDFNVGLSDPDALEQYIAGKRDSGTFLSVLGFGRGTLDDRTMQTLAQNGNGQAAYIDSLPEAQKVLVDQLSGALFTIASDVKLQVEFNPAEVAEYRLIGYETRALRREDFNNDAVDAGEIGAGHQVTALYEITRAGSGARRIDALRYGGDAVGNDETGSADAGELGYLKLRYKTPDGERSQLVEMPIPTNLEGDTDLQFAAAIAGFGETLRSSPYLGSWSLADAIELATGARSADPFGYRAEAIGLMRLAESLRR